MADQIAMMVTEYNRIEEELSPLQDAEEQLCHLDGIVATTTGEIDRRQTLLTKTQLDEARLQNRIRRNENPSFFHHFVCNRQAKVERLKGEKEELDAITHDLSSKLSTDSAQLTDLQQQRESTNGAVERKHELERRSDDIFNHVVDVQPPTQELHQLRAGVQQERGLEASEQALLLSVTHSAQQVKQGLALFQQASKLYQDAGSKNEQAKNVSFIGVGGSYANGGYASSPRGSYLHKQGSYMSVQRKGLDAARFDIGDSQNPEKQKEQLDKEEKELQVNRDKMIKEAHDATMQAYQVISTAFATFPAEARVRYPMLCASFGKVTFPRLQGANFPQPLMNDAIFGTYGAETKNISSFISNTPVWTPTCGQSHYGSGYQIQDNVRILGQCSCMTAQQLDMVAAMQNAVTANVQQLQAKVNDLEHNIQVERSNIFNSVREAVMSSVSGASGAVDRAVSK